MKRTKFTFKQNYYEAVSLISDPAVQAELILAITDYGINGVVYQGDSEIIKVAMALIMPQIDRENRRYVIEETVKTDEALQPAVQETSDAQKPEIDPFPDRNEFHEWVKDNAPNVYKRFGWQNIYHDYYELVVKHDFASVKTILSKLDEDDRRCYSYDSIAHIVDESQHLLHAA